jgi:hypothetical protein
MTFYFNLVHLNFIHHVLVLAWQRFNKVHAHTGKVIDHVHAYLSDGQSSKQLNL